MKAEFTIKIVSSVIVEKDDILPEYTKFNMKVSPNIKQENFVSLENQVWTEAGVEMLLHSLTSASVAAFKIAKNIGMSDADLISNMITKLGEGFVTVSNVQVSSFSEE